MPAPAARPAADVDALRRALAQAPDDAARLAAADALGRALGALRRAPEVEDPPAVHVAALRAVEDKATALAWVDALRGDALLAEAALHARYAEARLAAARRIEDAAVLESLARDSRGHDKGVYRYCADLLRGRREAARRAEQAAALADALRTLVATAPVPVSRLIELEHQLRALGDDAAASAPCEELLAQANTLVLQQTEARRAVQAHAVTAAELDADCAAAAAADAAPLEPLRVRLDALSQVAAAWPAWLAAEPAARASAQSLQAAGERLASLQEEARRIADADRFLSALERDRQVAVASEAPAAVPPSAAPTTEVPTTELSPTGVQTAEVQTAALASTAASQGASVDAIEAFVAVEPLAAEPPPTASPPTALSPPEPPPAADASRTDAASWRIDAQAAAAWRALPMPQDAAARRALQQRWEALQPRAEPPASPAPTGQKPARPAKSARTVKSATPATPANPSEPAAPVPDRPAAPARAAPDPAKLRSGLEALEQALDAGHLVDAEAAARSLKGWIEGHALRGDAESRWQRAQARLAQLRGWAQWSAAQHREQLCAAAEALRDGQVDIERIAKEVPQLRAQWKLLDAQGAASRSLWERFDGALEQAYAPVAARRAEEAAKQAEVRAAKEALLQQWTAELEALGADDAVLPAVEAMRQRIVAAWNELPRAGFREERALRRRFDPLVGRLDARLRQAREAEIARREALVAQAQALREAPDLREAIAAAKAIQQRWRDEAGAVRLSPADDRRLWQRLRAACDAVFARREAQRAEHAAQREERVQARRQRLETFVAVVDAAEADSAPDPGALQREIARFREAWGGPARREAGEAGEAADAGLERAGRDVLARAQRRLDALRRQAARDRYQRLAHEASAADGLDAEALQRGHAERAAILVDLEIALDLPTPPAWAQARRQRQLERLQKRFGAGSATPAADELLRRWYATPATPDPAFEPRIEAAIDRLLANGEGR